MKEIHKQLLFVLGPLVFGSIVLPILVFLYIFSFPRILVDEHESENYLIKTYRTDYGATASSTIDYYLVDKSDFFETEQLIYGPGYPKCEIVFTEYQGVRVARFMVSSGVMLFDLENQSFIKLGLHEEFKILFEVNSVIEPSN